MAEFREKAERQADRPTSRFAAVIVVIVWLAVVLMAGAITWHYLTR